MNLDRSLFPAIQFYQQKLAAAVDNLSSTYHREFINKATHEYTQRTLKKNPHILLPTIDAVVFYRRLSCASKLEEIILWYKRELTIKALPTLGLKEDCLKKTKEYLRHFRLCRLKKHQPGDLTLLLDKKGYISTQKPTDKPQSKVIKRVRFNLP